jgi:hypothetical protein
LCTAGGVFVLLLARRPARARAEPLAGTVIKKECLDDAPDQLVVATPEGRRTVYANAVFPHWMDATQIGDRVALLVYNGVPVELTVENRTVFTYEDYRRKNARTSRIVATISFVVAALMWFVFLGGYLQCRERGKIPPESSAKV